MKTAIPLVAAVAVGAAGCARGATPTAARPGGSAPTPTSCAAVADRALGDIARRIYDQAATGRNVAGARARLARSRALAVAVARGDAPATRLALAPLLRAQIQRIVVRRHAAVLADVGRAPALAPVSGVIRLAGRPVGTYAMSVAGQAAIAGVIHSTTGARVAIVRGRAPAGATLWFPAEAFPRGGRRIALTIPRADRRTCTVAATDLAVAERLFAVEAHGAAVRRVLRHVTRDRGFRRAVARDDPVALRAAIVRFFQTPSLHVVRIRATTSGGRLVGDVGGPYVLAPASAAVPGTAGRVTLSIQDDTGYIKLLERFTGARVVLRTRAGVVPGSARTAPARSSVEAFAARAFPDGPLRVTLLVPDVIART